MKMKVRLASEEDRFLVSSIRRKAYSQGDYLIRDPIQLGWGPSDRLNSVLIFEVDGTPVSTTRLDLTEKIEEVEFKLQCSRELLPLDNVYRYGIFCRGATLPEYQGKGFYHYLHLAGLKFFKEKAVDIVVRSFASDFQVVASLRELHATVIRSPQKWNDFISTDRDTYISYFQRRDLDRAIEKLVEKCEKCGSHEYQAQL